MKDNKTNINPSFSIVKVLDIDTLKSGNDQLINPYLKQLLITNKYIDDSYEVYCASLNEDGNKYHMLVPVDYFNRNVCLVYNNRAINRDYLMVCKIKAGTNKSFIKFPKVMDHGEYFYELVVENKTFTILFNNEDNYDPYKDATVFLHYYK